MIHGGPLNRSSWYTDLLSGGSDPGLNLFEKSDDLPGLWTRIKSLFTPLFEPDGGEEADGDGDADHSADEWDDHSGTGSGWRQPRRAHDAEGADAGAGGGDFELDEVDDLLETIVILGVMLGIAGLVFLRQRWDAVRANVGV